jgi:hypothetical protein
MRTLPRVLTVSQTPKKKHLANASHDLRTVVLPLRDLVYFFEFSEDVSPCFSSHESCCLRPSVGSDGVDVQRPCTSKVKVMFTQVPFCLRR